MPDSRPFSAEEVLLVVPCPWCKRQGVDGCMYVESDKRFSSDVRVGALCDEAFNAGQDHGDAMGNDWGRSNWFSNVAFAIKEWNEIVEAGNKTDQLGVW